MELGVEMEKKPRGMRGEVDIEEKSWAWRPAQLTKLAFLSDNNVASFFSCTAYKRSERNDCISVRSGSSRRRIPTAWRTAAVKC